MLLEASDKVRRNSLILRLVAEAVEVPQDHLAKVEVASVEEGRGERGGEGDLSACSKSIIITGARMEQLEAWAWKASRYMAKSLWVRSM